MKRKIFFTIVFVLVFAILVFGLWSMLKSNKNNKLFKLIEQQKTNEGLSMTIDELASLTKIQEVAEEQGLSYNNNKILNIMEDLKK